MTGELAVKFFEKSGLNPLILGEVRSIPEKTHGSLTDAWAYTRSGELRIQKTEDY